jgi:hypothetical protein
MLRKISRVTDYYSGGQRFLHAVHHHCIINILFHRSDNAAKATTLAGKFKGTLYHLWTEK